MTAPSGPATYVFCLVQSGPRPSLRGAPGSVPGAGPVRLLAVSQGLWAAVADAPVEKFSGERLEHDLQDFETVSRHALAHAAIVEYFFRRTPVIPLRLFTLFSGDERARRSLAGRKASLTALFSRLNGLEEWGVRIIAGSPEAVASRPAAPSGRHYLQMKRQLRDRNSHRSPAAVKDAASALKALAILASRMKKDAVLPPSPENRALARASFLVSRTRRREWKARAEQLAASLAGRGHRLEVTGPWPPYHFTGSR